MDLVNELSKYKGYISSLRNEKIRLSNGRDQIERTLSAIIRKDYSQGEFVGKNYEDYHSMIQEFCGTMMREIYTNYENTIISMEHKIHHYQNRIADLEQTLINEQEQNQ